MKATCPKHPNCKRFYTTVVVEQEWLVNSEGKLLEVYRDLDVLQGPRAGVNWYCYECGRIIKITEKETCEQTMTVVSTN